MTPKRKSHLLANDNVEYRTADQFAPLPTPGWRPRGSVDREDQWSFLQRLEQVVHGTRGPKALARVEFVMGRPDDYGRNHIPAF